MNPRNFFAELKRGNVYKVAASILSVERTQTGWPHI